MRIKLGDKGFLCQHCDWSMISAQYPRQISVIVHGKIITPDVGNCIQDSCWHFSQAGLPFPLRPPPWRDEPQNPNVRLPGFSRGRVLSREENTTGNGSSVGVPISPPSAGLPGL